MTFLVSVRVNATVQKPLFRVEINFSLQLNLSAADDNASHAGTLERPVSVRTYPQGT